MICILNIIGSLERGGAETFLINLYRNIDRTKIQFDFIIYNEPTANGYYQEVLNLGGKVFVIPTKSKGLLRNFKAIQEIVRENDYKMVWRYTSSCFGALDLLAAKFGGASELILNSRNTHTNNKLQLLIHYVLKPFVPSFITKGYACGIMAGKWMFGRHPFEVIDNGIEVADFQYDENLRNRHRQEFELQDKIVVGHVGRFHPVKNHKLIIDVYEKFRQKVSRSALVLVGTGDLLVQIQELVKEKGLEEDVLFLGSRSDVPEILQMMDVFIMPSLFEGFPRAFLEAQAAGLPCVVSSTISREADVTGNASFVDLDASVDVWAEKIAEKCGLKTEDNTEKLKAAGYDIKDVAKKIERYMLEKVES